MTPEQMREAAAQAAEQAKTKADRWGDESDDLWNAAWREACDYIAARIRALSA